MTLHDSVFRNVLITTARTLYHTLTKTKELVPRVILGHSARTLTGWQIREIKINIDAVTTKIGGNVTSNNRIKTMDTAPILNNDRTMVPLRAIGEALGKIVYYNDKYICISDIDLNMSDDSAMSRKSTITSAKVPDKIEVVAINGTGQNIILTNLTFLPLRQATMTVTLKQVRLTLI